MIYVNIYFTEILLLGFGRYCGKLLPEPFLSAWTHK